MNISATILLAFGMSMDAFAASIGKGATLHKPKFSEALRTGLIFGAIETLTPLVGWGLGMLASQFVLEWNHWIAFVLLVFLGGRMVIEGFRGGDDEECEAPRRHRAGYRLRHLYHVDAGNYGWPLYRPAARQTGRNSRRYCANRYRRTDSVEPFRPLALTLRAASSGS